MNTRHGYGITGTAVPESFRRVYGDGTAAYLTGRYPDKVATVLFNTVSLRYGYAFTPIQQGKWDAAFSLLGNPDVAFDLTGSPLGNDVFDAGSYYFPSVTYKDVFTGFIFYKPLEEHYDKIGFVHEFDGFEDSALLRASCVDKSMVEKMKERIDRYEKDPGTLIYAEPERYALLINLLQLMPMLILVVMQVILVVILTIFGIKSSDS